MSGSVPTSKLRFLSDEDFNERVVLGLERRLPGVEIVRLRDLGLVGEPDPVVLAEAAAAGLVLLTHDASTMPWHAADALLAGQALPGVVVVPQRLAIGSAIEDLAILVQAGAPEDFRDRILRLPL